MYRWSESVDPGDWKPLNDNSNIAPFMWSSYIIAYNPPTILEKYNVVAAFETELISLENTKFNLTPTRHNKPFQLIM